MRSRIVILLVGLVIITAAIVLARLSGTLSAGTASLFLNALTALGTVGVVILALDEITMGREAVAEAGRAAEAGIENAEAAQRAVVESIRARLDSSAPRIVVVYSDVESQPFLYRGKQHMPFANERSLTEDINASKDIDDSYEFYIPRDEGLLWFVAYGCLLNEGSGSALVRPARSSEFVRGPDPFRDVLNSYGSDGYSPPSIGGAHSRERLLLPGRAAIFKWCAGHTVSEWIDADKHPDPPNPNGFLSHCVYVADVRDRASVVDYFYAEMSGRPLEPVPDKVGAWRLRRPQGAFETRMGISGYPVQRWYPALGDKQPKPPYVERFEEWRRLHQQEQKL